MESLILKNVARQSRLKSKPKLILKRPYSMVNKDDEWCEYLLIYYKIMTDGE
jgi:hypothetical protein